MRSKPYHQGQLDFFCVIYAFINALRLTHGLQIPQGRSILADALLELSGRPVLWKALLHNETDGRWLMDYLLGRFCRTGELALRMARLPARPYAGLETLRLNPQPPRGITLDALQEEALCGSGTEFDGTPRPGVSGSWKMQELRPMLQEWLPGRGFFGVLSGQSSNRCLVLRFHHFLNPGSCPVISHWSTGRALWRDTIHLYDCTASQKAIHHLPLQECALSPGELGQNRLLAVEPESIYFLEKS